jgi:hypothetical protein
MTMIGGCPSRVKGDKSSEKQGFHLKEALELRAPQDSGDHGEGP